MIVHMRASGLGCSPGKWFLHTRFFKRKWIHPLLTTGAGSKCSKRILQQAIWFGIAVDRSGAGKSRNPLGSGSWITSRWEPATCGCLPPYLWSVEPGRSNLSFWFFTRWGWHISQLTRTLISQVQRKTLPGSWVSARFFL